MRIKWLRYQWDLEAPEARGGATLPPYVFRKAEGAEADVARNVITSAFSLDSGFEDTAGYFLNGFKKGCEEAFDQDAPSCVVVQHGARVVGVSVVKADPGLENHLITGPILFHEYRNRGIGSILLSHSLDLLRDLGLREARGITQDRSIAARFVYPKFGGRAEEFRMPARPKLVA